MNISGTSNNDNLVGTTANDVLTGGAGYDTLDGGVGSDQLFGGSGNDLYLIHDRFDSVFDSAGNDSGRIYVDFYKTDSSVENWSWASGVQKLPYWIDALLPGIAPGYVPLLGGSKTIYYCFPASAPAHFSSADSNGFKPFNAQQQAFAKQAFAYISSVVDIQFVESGNPGALNTIVLANNLQTGSAGYAYFPFDNYLGSDVLLNYGGSSAKNLTPQIGDYSALTLIHELGHALGLKHPFMNVESDGDTSEGPYLPAAEDSSQWSVMSYNSHVADYQLHYSPLDIAALQYLYGPSGTQSANDVYTISAGTPNFIWDGGGNDTIDASSQTQPVTLYLEPGYWGYVGSKAALVSAAGQITVNFGSVIENAKGGAAGDLIVGNSADNHIYGLAGNDTIYGEAGDDTLDGGDGDDALYGGAANDSFAGLSGRDAIYGGEGADRLQLALAMPQAQVMKLRSESILVNDDKGNIAILHNVEQIQFADGILDLPALAIADNIDSILAQIYVAAFRRAPESAGYNYWANDVAARGLAAVAETIFSLDIVKAIYPSEMTAQQFVTTIYNNVFNRTPDVDGLNYWVHRLASESRGQLVIDITGAALNVPDGTDGKDYFQNRLDWSLYALNYQSEQHRELAPSHLAALTDGVNADAGSLLTLIGQAQSGLVI